MSKVYLCVDLRLEGKIKTCYLLHEDFEALLKFTSFCDNERMLISTLPAEEINIPEYISKNIDGNRFYFKKHKNSEPFNILYKNDDDVLYADYKEIISIIPATTVEDIIEFLCLFIYSSLSFSYISFIFTILEK